MSLKARFPGLILSVGDSPGLDHQEVTVRKDGVLQLFSFLKENPEFDFDILMDMTAVDYLHWEEKDTRFEIVYSLYSFKKNRRLFVKAPVSESDAAIDSLTSLWPAANWYEREVWDMFGIVFKGHPDLKRLLMYEEFQGHPLRKDYPYNQRQPLIGPEN